MQATKPITTSANKKCQQKSQQANVMDKSVAQRVMDVAANATTTSNTTVTSSGQLADINIVQAGTLLKQSSSNNSVENDHEVETITSRAVSKIDASPVNSNTSSTSNINGNLEPSKKQPLSVNGQQQFAPADGVGVLSKSSSLILTSPIASTQQTHQQQDRFKSVANNEHHTTTVSGSCQVNRAVGGTQMEPTRIALDTKVPNPHKLATSRPPSAFQPARFENDEVSYYNDTSALEQPNGKLCHELKQTAAGSLENSAHPKHLLVASQVVSSQINSNGGGSSNNNNSVNTNKQQQQPRSNGDTVCQQQRLQANLVSSGGQTSSKLDVYQNDTKENHRAGQASFDEHNYMTADYDVYDVHYDNAPVVEKEAAANQQQQRRQQQQKDASNGYSRYHEISSPVPAITSNSSPTQNSCSTHRVVSISTSPKAKSAPATPCNVTPTAFHQNGSHLSSMLNPNLANTLPPDIRKNISATCRVLPSSIDLTNRVTNGGDLIRAQQHQQQLLQAAQKGASSVQPISFKYLDSLIKRGEIALAEKNYTSAIKLFSQCINLATENQNVNYLKKNFKIYSHRAEAHFKLGNYNEAIDDSMAARELNPKWTQAYYLQGRAQFMIGQYADSLAVFSFGLTQDPNSEQLFNALVDAALSNLSSFRHEFEPKFSKLKTLQLDRRPFVVVAILGQELLAKGHSEHAAIILESALKLSSSSSLIGGNNHELLQLTGGGGVAANNQKKFKSSVLSTISMAYCMLRDYEKAICYMNKELEIEAELEDINGQCRVLSNLGYTYFKVRNFDKSLEAHRKQLNLAMRTHLYPQASQALNAIGHVHAAKNDHSNALTSHTRCLDILKQLDDDCYAQFKEMLAIGHVQLMLNDLKAAEEKFDEANQLLKQKHAKKIISYEEFTTGSIMINFNLAHLALRRQLFSSAIQHYESVLELTHSFSNNGSAGFGATIKRVTYEMRACNGLGQTCRLMKKFDEAHGWFEKQLRLAKTLKDQVGQSRALCNLGMICQHFEDHQEAWRLFDENLKLVDNNLLLKAYAHTYMGSTYYLMNHPKESREHYELSLSLFKELGYFPAEQRTIEQNIASIKRRTTGHAEVVNSSTTTALMTQNNLPTTANLKKVMMAS